MKIYTMGEVIKVCGDRPNFLKDALSQNFADVFLCCSGGQRFLAHRLVLSAASSYLHEVLLAHGKIVGQYEPTTVILAEVEGHDLAAILGFLYTGSVAVPSARLEAFSSTADALKIRIPPLPLALKDQTTAYNLKNNLQIHKYLNLHANVQKNEERHENLSTENDEKGLNLKIDKTVCLRRLLMSESITEKKLSTRDVVKLKSHVANRVFASPWCQLMRPYHSPKSRNILRNSESCGKNIYDIPFDSLSSVRQEATQDESPSAKNMNATVGVEGLSNSLIHDLRHVAIADDYSQNYFRNETPAATNTDIAQSDRDVNHLSTDPNVNTPAIDHLTSNYKPDDRLLECTDPAIQRIDDCNIDTANTVIHNNVSTNEDNNNNNTNHDHNSNNHEHDHNDNSVKPEVEEVSTIPLQDLDRKDSDGTFFSFSLKCTERSYVHEKPFKCADCNKQFSQLRNYKYHRSMHEGTGEFAATCPECGKYFNDRGYLGSHMKIHRNRKEYSCNECGKSFNQRVAYNMHVRIHTGIKPHRCEECGKSFSRKMLLKQHLRTHSGERPYQCHICNKAFADRSNMTLHTRLHSGLKPYQCDICSKAFTKKHHLKTHLNYHTGTKPYACPNCLLTFSQSSNMRTHYKKCINNKSSEDIENKRKSINSNKKKKVERSVIKFSGALTPPHSDLESQVNNLREVS